MTELDAPKTPTEYQVALLAFVNCIIISTQCLQDRVRIRNEFIGKFFTFYVVFMFFFFHLISMVMLLTRILFFFGCWNEEPKEEEEEKTTKKKSDRALAATP